MIFSCQIQILNDAPRQRGALHICNNFLKILYIPGSKDRCHTVSVKIINNNNDMFEIKFSETLM